ncbi:YraN family protein [Streptomyces sp. NPDC002574]|uniref:YraN family protein n=1 Tax=Streptomyces sp. NPDC002574 TaxID=3364652 RepID=UPI0036AC71CF
MNARGAFGRYGEELAARSLAAAGMTVLERNWRCRHRERHGEIDIVAADGDAVVVCEVKSRAEGGPEHPMAAVTARKAERLRRLAECWLADHGGPPPQGGVRIDVVGVTLPERGAARVEHVRGAA